MFASFILGAVLSLTALEHDRDIQLPAGRSMEIAVARLRAETDDLEKHRIEVASAEELDFRVKMNQFAIAYNAFVEDYAKGLLNVKKAKTLSKAMRQLQSQLPRD